MHWIVYGSYEVVIKKQILRVKTKKILCKLNIVTLQKYITTAVVQLFYLKSLDNQVLYAIEQPY